MRVIEALSRSRANLPGSAARLDWRRRASTNIAAALLVYTALQVVLSLGIVRITSAILPPYVALALLIVAIIPGARRFERRWTRLSDGEAADPARGGVFHREMAGLWLTAIALPFVFGLLYWAIARIF